MAIGHKLGLRLFLEGIEVPVISAQIQVVADAPAAASIQIIATDRALDFLPRTMVHLFFYDFVEASSNTPTTRKNKKKSTLSPDLELTDDEFDPGSNQDQAVFDHLRYKLLFMGEVQGISFSKDAGNRSVMLSCVDFSNYWDTTYQYNFGGQLLGGRREAAFIGANANLLTSPLGHGVGTISRLLAGNSANFPDLRGLLAGIVHVLEAVGGTYQGEWTFKGANDFTSIAELRIKLLRQIWAAEKDTSTKDLFQRKTFNMWMNRESAGLGKLVTFRGLVQLMQKFVYHEVYPNPAAYYQPTITGLNRIRTSATDLSKDRSTQSFWQKMQSVERSRESVQRKLSESLNFAYEPRSIEADLNSMVATVKEMLNSVPSVPGVNLLKTVNDIAANLKDLKENIGVTKAAGIKLDPDKMADSSRVNAAVANCDKMYRAYQALLGVQIKHQRTVAYDKPDRINNQLYRPDIWFAAAPRCNVLFPEMYSNFSWNRNFLREVTRLELQLTHEVLGDDSLFNQRNYSPNVKDMRKGVTLSSRKFNHLILAHELMTGIIPMYEKMTQANLFAMRGKAVQQDNIEQKSRGGGIQKVDYAQRAVDHQYFKHRFASRQMSAGGRFNPWFVPGFPSIIIDKPMNMEELGIASLPIDEMVAALESQPGYQSVSPDPRRGNKPSRAQLLRNLIGYQYTGVCVQLSHSVGQDGGSTSYAFAQARVHREDTEFLGVDKITRSRKTGKSVNHKNVYGYPTGIIPKVGSKGPRGGKIISVRNVTPTQVAQMGHSVDVPYQDNTEESIRKAPGPWRMVPNYNGNGMVMLGPDDDDPSNPEKFYYGWQVVETIDVREKYEDRRPMEEAVRPPWIWSGWWNLNIGDTYNEMIGTNSITDIQGAVYEMPITLIGTEEETALDETKEGYRAGSGAYLIRDEGGTFHTRTKDVPIQDKPIVNKVSKRKKTDPAGLKDEPALKIHAADTFMVDADRTIEASIDYLVRVYSLIKVGGFDVGEFIRQYTWRPIMTIEQLLGSLDLVLQEDGGQVDVGQGLSTGGVEGFHSRAFGNVSDLVGLVNPQVRKVLGLSTKNQKDHATLMRMDTRQRKWDAVMAYSDELLSRGLLG